MDYQNSDKCILQEYITYEIKKFPFNIKKQKLKQKVPFGKSIHNWESNIVNMDFLLLPEFWIQSLCTRKCAEKYGIKRAKHAFTFSFTLYTWIFQFLHINLRTLHRVRNDFTRISYPNWWYFTKLGVGNLLFGSIAMIQKSLIHNVVFIPNWGFYITNCGQYTQLVIFSSFSRLFHWSWNLLLWLLCMFKLCQVLFCPHIYLYAKCF